MMSNSSHSNIAWEKIADSIEAIPFQANQMCIVAAHGKSITLATYQNQLYAFAHKCPHASGIMATGFIDAAGNAVCPLHRYKFNIANGRNTSGEGYYLATYLVEVRPNDGIYIGMKQSSWRNWL